MFITLPIKIERTKDAELYEDMGIENPETALVDLKVRPESICAYWPSLALNEEDDDTCVINVQGEEYSINLTVEEFEEKISGSVMYNADTSVTSQEGITSIDGFVDGYKL